MSRRASPGARLAQVLRYGKARPKAAARRRSGPRPRRRRAPAKRAGSNWTNWLGIVAFAFVASALGFGWVLGGLDPDRIAGAVAGTGLERASFSLCDYDNGNNCVIDGDTFRYRGTTIRIADIDTPEVFSYACPSEREAGERATRRLHALLNAGPFALEGYGGRDEDRYGRKLRVVTRDGQSLGMVLVAEGLAREWDGARRGWC
jgi:micrococcal nuclease